VGVGDRVGVAVGLSVGSRVDELEGEVVASSEGVGLIVGLGELVGVCEGDDVGSREVVAIVEAERTVGVRVGTVGIRVADWIGSVGTGEISSVGWLIIWVAWVWMNSVKATTNSSIMGIIVLLLNLDE
jgi:hypothetical protein